MDIFRGGLGGWGKENRVPDRRAPAISGSRREKGWRGAGLGRGGSPGRGGLCEEVWAGRVQTENGQRTSGFSRLRFGPVRELGVSI